MHFLHPLGCIHCLCTLIAELHTQSPSNRSAGNLAYFQDVCPCLTGMTHRRFPSLQKSNWGEIEVSKGIRPLLLRQLNSHNPLWYFGPRLAHLYTPGTTSPQLHHQPQNSLEQAAAAIFTQLCDPQWITRNSCKFISEFSSLLQGLQQRPD